jgi:hypothetical protein
LVMCPPEYAFDRDYAGRTPTVHQPPNLGVRWDTVG